MERLYDNPVRVILIGGIFMYSYISIIDHSNGRRVRSIGIMNIDYMDAWTIRMTDGTIYDDFDYEDGYETARRRYYERKMKG